MTIDLSAAVFENDFLSVDLPSGDVLTLNNVNEDFTSSTESLAVKRINIQITHTDEETGEESVYPVYLSIGQSTDVLSLNTLYTEYEGQVLDMDNMAYCTIEVYE